jgi:hypothetical protein
VIAALERAGWVQARAARLLGMTPRQIAYRVQILNIEMKQNLICATAHGSSGVNHHCRLCNIASESGQNLMIYRIDGHARQCRIPGASKPESLGKPWTWSMSACYAWRMKVSEIQFARGGWVVSRR